MSSSSVCIAGVTRLHGDLSMVCWLCWLVLGRTPLPTLYWATEMVGGPESRSVTTGKPISSQLQHGRLIRAALICLDFLELHAKLSSHLGNILEGHQEVMWATN
jgi:hypothetical protein